MEYTYDDVSQRHSNRGKLLICYSVRSKGLDEELCLDDSM
jgi:hypothetical protein